MYSTWNFFPHVHDEDQLPLNFLHNSDMLTVSLQFAVFQKTVRLKNERRTRSSQLKQKNRKGQEAMAVHVLRIALQEKIILKGKTVDELPSASQQRRRSTEW